MRRLMSDKYTDANYYEVMFMGRKPNIAFSESMTLSNFAKMYQV